MKDNMFWSERYPGVYYDPNQGSFWRAVTERRLFPNESGLISYLCPETSKNVKKKATVLAWEIFNNKPLPDDMVVYLKDGNPDNLTISNIGIIHKEEYVKLKDSLYNVNSGIKITPHKVFAFQQIITFKHKGKLRKLTCQDSIQANRIKKILLLKATKLLSKYLVSNS